MTSNVSKVSFKIHQTNDARTIIESPLRDSVQALCIKDSSITVGNRADLLPASNNSILATTDAMGVLGMIELSFGRYLLLITARVLVASIQTHKIWKITKGVALPIGSGVPKLNDLDQGEMGRFAVDQEILKNIMEVVHSGRLFYSSTYDLTHSLQHAHLKGAAKGGPSATVIDDRYFFNQHLLKDVIEANEEGNVTTPWIFKCIAGFAGMVEMDYKDLPGSLSETSASSAYQTSPTGDSRTYHVVLISRINHRRLGTRYVRRGLDEHGNAANSVEMEQIVYNHDFLKNSSIASYCQVRGSVPAIWGQDLDLSYRPRLLLTDLTKEPIWHASKSHMADLKHQYIGDKTAGLGGADTGLVVCINLLDDTGFEGALTGVYEEVVKRFADGKVRYESFPMNKWCKKMNYGNMEILLDRVRLPLVNSGWFVGEGQVPTLADKGTLRVSKIQTGIVRVSCLDSLDRTNLTCSIFAKYMIPFQTQSISTGLPSVTVLPLTGVSPSEVRDPVAPARKALEGAYRALINLWADSGDSVSLMYAGTGALKADVTRTGKRQMVQGSYNDGVNALTRYYLNNFTHGHLQDSYDLLTGHITVAQVQSLAEREGPRKADRMRRPLLSRSSFPGSLVPAFLLDVAEPVYFNLRESLEKEGAKSTTGKGEVHVGGASRMVVALKEMAPAKIDNLVQLYFALLIFFWILLLTKLLNIKGSSVVDFPRLTREDAKLKELQK